MGHGESITIAGLLEGSRYSVTESDYSEEGYIQLSKDASGSIVANSTQVAAFTNRWPGLPGEPVDPEPDVPGHEPEPEPELEPEPDPDPKTEPEPEPEPGLELELDPGAPGKGDKSGDVPDKGAGDMPQTGESPAVRVARYALFFFSLALAILFTVEYFRRKRLGGKRS